MLGHASAMTLDTWADLFDDDLADSVRTDGVILHPLTRREDAIAQQIQGL
jgi:hypothetical protein